MTKKQADLMGSTEVAAYLGVSRQRVLQLLAGDKTFPEPVAVLNMGKVWAGAEIREWAVRNDRA